MSFGYRRMYFSVLTVKVWWIIVKIIYTTKRSYKNYTFVSLTSKKIYFFYLKKTFKVCFKYVKVSTLLKWMYLIQNHMLSEFTCNYAIQRLAKLILKLVFTFNYL